MKKNFITLLSTENYLEAVLVLNRSFKLTNTKYPLIAGVTDELAQNPRVIDVLNRENIPIEVITTLKYNDFIIKRWTDDPGEYVLHTASKYSLFDLKEYDKLCYIDADTIVMENIDELLDYPDGSIIYDGATKKNGEYEKGFSALFVFNPRNHNSKYYIELSKVFNEVDGGLIGDLWFYVMDSPAHQIPLTYCWGYNSHLSDKKVAHFSGYEKPWLNEKYYENDDNKIIRLYRSLLKEVKSRYPKPESAPRK